MEVVDKSSEAPPKATQGQPAFESEQPTMPAGGVDKTGEVQPERAPIPTGSEAAKAQILAKSKPPAAKPAEPAPAAEVTDEAIAKAADKVKALTDVKAAVLDKPEDDAAKYARAAEAAKTDPLKALEIIGISLDAAVRKAMGAPATTTSEEKLQAEVTRLAAENAEIKRQGEAAAATARAEASYHATVAAVVADAAFPNITKPEQVAEALKEAKEAYKTLVSDVGRDLNETEKDRLVKHYLKRYNDREMASESAPTKAAPSVTTSVKSGSVQPARPAKRTIAQVKADILAGKKTN